MNKRVVLFHPGTQHSWQTALALQRLDRLAFYATSIFYQPDRWPYRIERVVPRALAARIAAEFRRFDHPGLDPALVRTAGASEWLERMARRAGLPRLAARIDTIGNRRFAYALGREVAAADPFALWGYDGSALPAFRAAKRQGRWCVLDRTIGDWRAYHEAMAPVADRFPAFVPPAGWRIPAARIARDDAEYALADVILTGSPMAADSVRTHAADPAARGRVRVLPYCFDERLFGGLPPPRPRARHAPLRFLFLGQAGLRKGIHLALQLFARIPPTTATLTVVGELQLPAATWARYADRVRHRPTVARADVPALMRAHDILLFPSYFEGSALSLIEALAAGMGIIQSAQAGLGATPATGVVLPRPEPDLLAAAVDAAIADPARVDEWRHAAQAEAARYRFDRYRDGVAAILAALPSADRG